MWKKFQPIWEGSGVQLCSLDVELLISFIQIYNVRFITLAIKCIFEVTTIFAFMSSKIQMYSATIKYTRVQVINFLIEL